MNEYGRQKIPFLFVIDFKINNLSVYPLHNIGKEDILFQTPDGHYSNSFPALEKEIIFEKKPISFLEYQKKFDVVMHHLKFGNSFLVNLSAPTPVQTNLSLKEIFYYSQAKYKIYFKNQFVCFSPETFIRIQSGKITSFPMKGTIDAGIPNAADIILNNQKEQAEHATIVDLIRNDLSRIASNVKVEKFRFLDEIRTLDKTLIQVSSKISADLPNDYAGRIGDILLSLLPAGSITGAPKPKTLEIIESAENYERGFYTGIFGCFDGENLDSAVMIRFIENIGNQFIFKSGGGITAFSEAYSEYSELIDKVYLPIFNS